VKADLEDPESNEDIVSVVGTSAILDGTRYPSLEALPIVPNVSNIGFLKGCIHGDGGSVPVGFRDVRHGLGLTGAWGEATVTPTGTNGPHSIRSVPEGSGMNDLWRSPV